MTSTTARDLRDHGGPSDVHDRDIVDSVEMIDAAVTALTFSDTLPAELVDALAGWLTAAHTAMTAGENSHPHPSYAVDVAEVLLMLDTRGGVR